MSSVRKVCVKAKQFATTLCGQPFISMFLQEGDITRFYIKIILKYIKCFGMYCCMSFIHLYLVKVIEFFAAMFPSFKNLDVS